MKKLVKMQKQMISTSERRVEEHQFAVWNTQHTPTFYIYPRDIRIVIYQTFCHYVPPNARIYKLLLNDQAKDTLKIVAQKMTKIFFFNIGPFWAVWQAPIFPKNGPCSVVSVWRYLKFFVKMTPTKIKF